MDLVWYLCSSWAVLKQISQINTHHFGKFFFIFTPTHLDILLVFKNSAHKPQKKMLHEFHLLYNFWIPNLWYHCWQRNNKPAIRSRIFQHRNQSQITRQMSCIYFKNNDISSNIYSLRGWKLKQGRFENCILFQD